MSIFLTYWEFAEFYPKFNLVFFLVILVALVVSLSLYWLKVKIGRFLKSQNTLFLTSIVFNVLFQQIVIFVMVKTIVGVFPTFFIPVFAILFSLLHFPIIFLKNLRLKHHQYLIYSFLGGVAFAFFIGNFESGYIVNYIMHFTFYVCLSMRIGEEARI